jgi:hypothetical protein
VSDHVGRRRRQSRLLPNISTARLLVLAVTIVGIIRLLTLPDPVRSSSTAPSLGGSSNAVPTWAGPAPVDQLGRLSDGSTYQPRLYLSATESIGIAQTTDGTAWRVLARTGGRTTELHRVPAVDLPQFDGFVASGDTVVWAESVSRASADLRTSLWRANWRTGAKATAITANTGEVTFLGGDYDLVVSNGRVSWVAVGAGEQTEVRSVALSGGTVAIQRLPGQRVLLTPPWVVNLAGGRGTPVEMLNLSTNQKLTVPTQVAEVATCSPTWCRMVVLNGNDLVRIDLQRPDGSDRRRIAGSEATPTITDVMLLDRYVPLKTDAGLSIYDVTTGRTDLVAANVGDVQARGSILWWSTGAGTELVWHAIDLRTTG